MLRDVDLRDITQQKPTSHACQAHCSVRQSSRAAVFHAVTQRSRPLHLIAPSFQHEATEEERVRDKKSNGPGTLANSAWDSRLTDLPEPGIRHPPPRQEAEKRTFPCAQDLHLCPLRCLAHPSLSLACTLFQPKLSALH